MATPCPNNCAAPASLADHLVALVARAMPRGLAEDKIIVALGDHDFDGDEVRVLTHLVEDPPHRLAWRSRRDEDAPMIYRIPVAVPSATEADLDAAVLGQLAFWNVPGDQGYETADLALYLRVPVEHVERSMLRLEARLQIRANGRRGGWWALRRGVGRKGAAS